MASISRPGNGSRSFYALIDIERLKCAGSLPINEISDDLKIGDQVEVVILGLEDDEGLANVSMQTLREKRGWERVESDLENRTHIRFRAEQLMRGGILGTCKLGDSGVLEAFLPASRADVRKLHQLPRLLDQEFDVVVVEAERERGNIIVSQVEAMQDKQAQILEDLQEGQAYRLPVVGLAPFGAFLDLGNGLSGLLHASEFTWRSGKHDPADFVSVGDEVDVVLVEKTESKKGPRLAFSVRKLTDPWTEAANHLSAGDVVEGRVTNVKEGLGSFVSLAGYPRVVGLLRDDKRKKGEKLQVQLATFDPAQQRSRLSAVV